MHDLAQAFGDPRLRQTPACNGFHILHRFTAHSPDFMAVFKCSPVIFLFLFFFSKTFRKHYLQYYFCSPLSHLYGPICSNLIVQVTYLHQKKVLLCPKFTNPPGTKYNERSSSYFVRTFGSSSGLCQSLFHFCYVILICFPFFTPFALFLFLSPLIFGTFVIFFYSSS